MSYSSTWDARRDAILAAANRIKAQHPDAWEEVKVPGQKSRRYISLLAAECQLAVSPQIGCNLKRGGPDVSLDVLAMPNPSGCKDATGTFTGLELRDIITDGEGPNAHIGWGDATQKTIDAGVPGGWIKTATSAPQPPAAIVFPSYGELGDDAFFRNEIGKPLAADATLSGDTLNDGSSVWFSRATYLLLVAKMKEKMNLGPAVDPAAIVRGVRLEWRALMPKPPNGWPPL